MMATPSQQPGDTATSRSATLPAAPEPSAPPAYSEKQEPPPPAQQVQNQAFVYTQQGYPPQAWPQGYAVSIKYSTVDSSTV